MPKAIPNSSPFLSVGFQPSKIRVVYVIAIPTLHILFDDSGTSVGQFSAELRQLSVMGCASSQLPEVWSSHDWLIHIKLP